MKQQTTLTIDDRLLAVVERRSEGLRALLVRRSEMPTIVACETFRGNDYGAVHAWADSKRCGDIRVILPASATIVRQTTLPNAVPSQMLAALRLQAEGMFLGSIPLHRIGLGILPDSGSGERQGVIIGWPASQDGASDLGLNAKQAKITRFIPEMAAMIVLAGSETPAVSIRTGDGSIALAFLPVANQPGAGARAGSRGMVLRATRDQAGDARDEARAWELRGELRDGLRAVLAETALNAGIEPSRLTALIESTEALLVEAGGSVTALDPSFERVLSSAIRIEPGAAAGDADWWRGWAIPLAAAIAACGPYADLCGLRPHEEGASTSRVEHLVRRYSDPARALRVCAAAILIVGIAPILFAYLRGKIIEWKMPEAAPSFEKNQRDIVARLQQYEELSRRLPVAKLLGDLACCTPDGIEIESIQLSPSQGLTVRGIAKGKSDASAESLVTEMAGLLDASQIFARARPRWDPGDGRGMVKFDIEADVFRPILRFEFPENRDWAKQTLAQRKFGKPKDGEEPEGEDLDSGTSAAGPSASGSQGALAGGSSGDGSAERGASNGAVASADAAEGDSDGDGKSGSGERAAGPARGIARRSSDASSRQGAASSGSASEGSAPVSLGSGAGAGGGPAAAAAANIPVPDPVTEEQLAGMTRGQVQALLGPLAQAKKRKDLDAAVQKRIEEDWNRVLEHLKGKKS